MTPNKTEQLNSDNAQAAELVAWLRRLRLAEKASYAEIIRRINKRQAHSSPARSTISTTLSGKTNPRWETVEAIAWALGRDGAVAECQRRWELAYGHTLAPDNTPADVQPKWLGTRLDRPDSFQPRPDEHADLVAARASGRTAIVSGFHGTGKSQLAAAYAEELLPLDKSTGTFADGRSVDLIVWVPADDRSGALTVYAAGATHVGIGDPADPEAAAGLFLAWLTTTSTRWLVVLDNILDTDAITGLWPAPRPGTGQVVGTTVRTDDSLFNSRDKIALEGFSFDQAKSYLNERLHPGLADDPVGVAEDLQHLPLALSHAAAFMNDKAMRCTSYREEFGQRKNKLEDLFPAKSELFGHEELLTVAVTMSLAIGRANDTDPVGVAGALLELGCLLDPNGIPTSAFYTDAARAYIAGRTPLDTDIITDLVLTGGLANLDKFSIATRPSHGADLIRIHALVQRAAHDLLLQTPGLADSTTIICASMLRDAWPDIERDQVEAQLFRTNTTTLTTAQHGHALWNNATGAHPLLFRAARSLGEAGLLTQAIEATVALHETATNHLGPDHPDTFTARGRLVRWRGEAGDPAGAAATTEELLTDLLRVYGPDDPETLAARNNLAVWRGEAGDHAGAAATTEELLTDLLRVLGPDHPDTLAARSNLAVWRGETGDPAGAAAAFEELLTDQLRVHGPDDPDTLTARNNLAFWRGHAGDHAGAAAFEELLADRLRVLGPDHPDTLATRSNLAVRRGEAGDPAGAAVAFEELLADRLRILGPDHPDTLATRNNLASWRGEAGDHAGAAAFEELLTDQLRVLGPDHPLTSTTRNNLAYWRGEAG